MKRTLIVIVMVSVAWFASAADAGDLNLRPKSPGRATCLSLFGTLVGPLVPLGAAVGPGWGHLYAGNQARFWTGAGIRTVGLGGALVAYMVSDSPDDGTALTAFVVGMGLWFGSSIYDIATAAKSAREYNSKHGLSSLSMSPTFDLSKKQAGIKLSMQF